MGEAACLLFWTGSESLLGSPMSLSGGSKLNREYNLIKTTNIDNDGD